VQSSRRQRAAICRLAKGQLLLLLLMMMMMMMIMMLQQFAIHCFFY
jgi:hypothetical protein